MNSREERTAPHERGAEKRRGSSSAQLMEVISVQTTVGKGSEQDPKRIITEYWSKDGELLAVNDPID